MNLSHPTGCGWLQEKQLGFRRHAGVVRSKLAEAREIVFADRLSPNLGSRVTRCSHSRAREPLSQLLRLRRFSTPFLSLKRDEWQPRHDVDCEMKTVRLSNSQHSLSS